MKIVETDLQGVFILEPIVFSDSRGWFMESFKKSIFEKIGINVEFIQYNHSFSLKKGTLRGIHFQNNPFSQAKLVRCVRGKILDVVVDLRKNSPTYKKWIACELSDENKIQIFIPKGFGHGFVTLEDNVEVEYKVDNYYSKEHDRSIRYDDPEIGIEWGIDNPILSDKDRNAPFLRDSDCNFIYEGE
ncbi:MAG TPA: dTDP-4-dehydrorhamnose 3,5-epimerase [Spirochaetota bacterium]|nr:dTDP-4-dehydrorhamnose 3,5-epimerase [Spirochaetota bacterium]HOM39141.1 dTDP-4-dehydrorhamnose 3,5-epimerase [Spirochaetota bacterium]HPQ48318.1 dTDP-4-dehydrorhamnose 3,5-epimerase [Spirochaetota bacterium]